MIWQAYYILDELVIAGELQESSKKTVARLIAAQVFFIIQLMHFTDNNAVFFTDLLRTTCRILWLRLPKKRQVLLVTSLHRLLNESMQAAFKCFECIYVFQL